MAFPCSGTLHAAWWLLGAHEYKGSNLLLIRSVKSPPILIWNQFFRLVSSTKSWFYFINNDLYLLKIAVPEDQFVFFQVWPSKQICITKCSSAGQARTLKKSTIRITHLILRMVRELTFANNFRTLKMKFMSNGPKLCSAWKIRIKTL